ncbi:hypothetical protein [Angustibacter peucedani]
MLSLPRRRRHRTFHHQIAGLHAWVTWQRAEGVRLHGHHLMRGETSPFGGDVEYEYLITLTHAEQDELVALLGVRHPADLVDALADRSEQVMARGEQRWLREQLGPEATRLLPHLREL